MQRLIVSYDRNRGDNYAPLISALEKLGAKKLQYSLWLLRTNATAFQVGITLQRFLNAGDKLDVLPLGYGLAYSWPPRVGANALAA